MLFSLLVYDLIAIRTRAEDGTDLGEEVGSQMNKAHAKLEGVSENDLLCAWEMEPIEDIAYSR